MDALDFWIELMRHLNSETYHIAKAGITYNNTIGRN